MTERSAPSTYFATSTRAAKSSTNHLISVRLSDDLLARLAEVGNGEGLAMSDTIRLVLERGLAASKKKGAK
ncbi:MAG: hypothetical protein KGQ66_21010 [Acidobacteriota bacterium]|nr:hypothetical protein [Acidobacteriota bacterium]